jgi:hypothetical protein
MPTSEHRLTAIGKLSAAVFSLTLIGLTLAPIREYWKETPQDSFPFSNYPMFSAKRSETYTVNYLVGLDKDGQRHPLSYKLAGQGGFNQTRRQINKMIRDRKTSELCKSVAEKVAAKESSYGNIVKVQVITGTFNVDDFFAGRKEPQSERVRSTCTVKRDAQ